MSCGAASLSLPLVWGSRYIAANGAMAAAQVGSLEGYSRVYQSRLVRKVLQASAMTLGAARGHVY